MCNFFEILDAHDHKWKHVLGELMTFARCGDLTSVLYLDILDRERM